MTSADQPDLFAPTIRPEGLVFGEDLITQPEEAALLAHIARLPFAPFKFQGFEGKRRTVSFGYHYDFEGGRLEQAEPMPDWLQTLRTRAAAFAKIAAADIVQALVIEYAPGAGINWHRDRPVFGDVIGISLGTAAPLRFRRPQGEKWERFTLPAPPRSAYLLAGPSRWEWQHSIAPVEALRHSVTFRTLRA